MYMYNVTCILALFPGSPLVGNYYCMTFELALAWKNKIFVVSSKFKIITRDEVICTVYIQYMADPNLYPSMRSHDLTFNTVDHFLRIS